MDLQVLVSKKGTRVVTASNLHRVLGLPDHHFSTNLRKWLLDVYEFKDGIRKPEKMRDFAQRNAQAPVLKDYYLTLELAKLITLNSRSKSKKKYARWLYALEDGAGEDERLSHEQVMAMLQITRAMGMLSCQTACERRHLDIYTQRNGGKATNWWKHRSGILGYSPAQLRKQLGKRGEEAGKKSLRKLLFRVDKYETIRMGIIDLFMAMGKSEHYARRLGDLAKSMARALNLEIYDDREEANIFAPRVDPVLVQQVKSLEPKGVLSRLW